MSAVEEALTQITIVTRTESDLSAPICVIWCASTANKTNELKSVHHAN